MDKKACINCKHSFGRESFTANEWKRRRAPRCHKCKSTFREERKLRVLKEYGDAKCACCGEKAIEFLNIDHIGNSRKELRHTKRSGALYRWLETHDYPDKDKLRVLCYNCNCAIGTYGYCPHQE